MKNTVKFGMPPGTLIYTGDRQDLETHYEMVVYSQQEFLRTKKPSQDEMFEELSINKWILVKGFMDVAGIQYLTSAFDLTPLILEDVLNVNQRAHISGKDDKICLILRYYNLDFKRKQLSIWLTPKEVITFQETHDDLFHPIFSRLDSEHSETRCKGPDRLACVILDYITDMYYTVIDKLDDDISELETAIVNSPDPANHLKEIYQMKTLVQGILQDAKALREVVDNFIDDFDMLLTVETVNYAKDINNHAVQIIDTLEGYKATLSSIVDLSSAVSGNKMNEIMKFLTILSTFFLPLSLFTSWYGMNWDMPEQKHYPKGGYYAFVAFSIAVCAWLYFWFKKKKWL